MRSFLVAFTGLMLFATGAAQAKVAITIDKDNQQMTVAVDGVARRAPAPQYEQPYDSAGDPVVLTPQQQPVPQARADDGYIYPADGSSNEARYPAPPGSRRVYDAQAYPQPQQQYYVNRGYAPAPQGNYYQPRPYYQPRGLFTYQN